MTKKPKDRKCSCTFLYYSPIVNIYAITLAKSLKLKTNEMIFPRFIGLFLEGGT